MAKRIFQGILSPATAAKRFSTAPSASPVVSTAVSILKHHRSKSRWAELQSLFPDGFTSSEASQILITIKNDAHLALRFFDWSRDKSICNHDVLSYSTIIHILARSRQKRRAEALIRSAFRVSANSGVDLFESLVKSYRIVMLLQSKRISVNSRVLNLLISAVCQENGADAGYEMFTKFFRLMNLDVDVEIFNSLMNAYYEEGEFAKVRVIWDEMAEVNGVRPNENTYRVLLAACCDEGRMEEAEVIWGEIGVKEMKRDAVVFNTIIEGFCRIGEMDKAEDYWREMVLSGVENTCVTHESFVNGYCRVGDVDAALVACKAMLGGGFVVRGSMIDGLVGELCGKGRVVDGLDAFKAAMENKEFVPYGRSFSVLVKGLCSKGMMDEALKLQTEMASKGFEPDAEVYRAFMDGYEELGNTVKVESLRKEMLELHVNV